LKDALLFYATDVDALLFFGPVALVPCLIVLWMGGLFGRTGALIATAVFVAVALGMWTLPAMGAHGLYLLYTMGLVLPLFFGALLGLVLWYVWLGRAQKRR